MLSTHPEYYYKKKEVNIHDIKMWKFLSIEVSLKAKNRPTIWSSNPTPGHISGKKILIVKDTCAPVFIATQLQQPRHRS